MQRYKFRLINRTLNWTNRKSISKILIQRNGNALLRVLDAIHWQKICTEKIYNRACTIEKYFDSRKYQSLRPGVATIFEPALKLAFRYSTLSRVLKVVNAFTSTVLWDHHDVTLILHWFHHNSANVNFIPTLPTSNICSGKVCASLKNDLRKTEISIECYIL